MNYISTGILQINTNFKLKIRNNVGNINDLTRNLYDLYQKINISCINSNFSQNQIDLNSRKSKSEVFESVFNLNFILEYLKKNCKPGFFDSDWLYEIVCDKILVYKDGDFFKKHRDYKTENIENNGEHVGTFLISLNSEHKGGDLTLYKNGLALYFNTQPIHSDFGNLFKFILFSLDVEHEVLKLESGIRGCLKFKIYKYRNIVQIYETDLKLDIRKENQINFSSKFDNDFSLFKLNEKPTLFD